MKRLLCILTAALVSCMAFARSFGDSFENATLRLDYVFTGNAASSQIALLGAYKTDIWAGRRANLDRLPLDGNGRIEVLDPATGEVLYCNSFSTLFQEWQCTAEAQKVTKGYENCFQVPWPKKPVNIRVTLTDNHRRVSASLTHPIDPKDILIRPLKTKNSWRQIHGGGKYAEKIDVVIVGDGYTSRGVKQFWADASRTVSVILSHHPFDSLADRFNFIAIAAISGENGVSVPHEGKWVNTCMSSHFDTFYTERYLTTSSIRNLWFEIAGIPFEHIIVLSNTSRYGGGGIYNSLTLVAANNGKFAPVTVHEFGHAFAGLADEYFYDDDYSENYPDGVEPWEPNITTKVDFAAKWKDMLEAGTAGVGLFEGGGYRSKGIWRPADDCRMRTNECESFCPVCERAIVRMVDFHTRLEK